MSLCFVGDPRGNLKLKKKIQQEELNKDLRTSLFFQQGEFDTRVSSLSKQYVGMGGSNPCEHEFELIWKIWAFHGLFDLRIGIKRIIID